MTRSRNIGRGIGGGGSRFWVGGGRLLRLYGPDLLLDLIEDLGYKTPGRALLDLTKEKHRTSNKEYSIHTREEYDQFFKDQDAKDREITQGKETPPGKQMGYLNLYLKTLPSVLPFKSAVQNNDIEIMQQIQDEIFKRYKVRVSFEVMRERASWQSPDGPGISMKGS